MKYNIDYKLNLLIIFYIFYNKGPLAVCFANKINVNFSKDQKENVILNADG